MAEKTILVCDVCGAPATKTITLLVDGRRLRKDYCGQHLSELVKGARNTTRGRPAKTSSKKRVGSQTARRRRPKIATAPSDVAAQVTKLRGEGMSYRQIGDALLKRGVKPPRAKAWNPVVLGRMVKRSAA